MNDGQVTKTFIASGKNSERALTNFNNDWEHGFVETIYVPHQSSENISAVEVDNPKLAKGFNLMVIDNEAAAIKRAIEYISHINQKCSGIEVLGIMMVDPLDSTLSEELVGLHEKIKEATSACFIQVNQCTPMMIESLIAMYAHLYCGFSISCIELQDLSDTLKSGYYFEASKVAAATVFELPFAAYQAADKISIAANEFSKVEGLVLVIVSNGEFTDLSVFTACVDILKGFAHEDINLVFHTNIQPENAHSIHLGAVFKELRVKELPVEEQANDKTLDIPEFLRQS
jgi:hypothetical protein